VKYITIELSDDYYIRFENLAKRLGMNVEDYAKQIIENKTNLFYTDGEMI
jgi:Ribbon-helix-helix protein, copG family.